MYQKKIENWVKHLDFIIIDILCVEIALAISLIFKYGIHRFYLRDIYAKWAVVFILIDVLILLFFNGYKDILNRNGTNEAKATLRHTSYVMISFLLYLYFSKVMNVYPRSVYLIMWISFTFLSFACRFGWKYYLKNKNKLHHKNGNRKLVLVVMQKDAENIISNFKMKNFGDYTLNGLILMDRVRDSTIRFDIPTLADGNHALEYLKEGCVDEVFFSISDLNNEYKKLVEGCTEMGITTHINLIHIPQTACSQLIEQIAGYTVLSSSVKMVTARQLFWKRLIDICGGLVGCMLTLLIGVIIGPIIYIKSPGPIFFSQLRIGKNGRRFHIYKFRSMHLDAEKRKKDLMEQNNIEDGLMFKMDNDPRIIKGIGEFIRKTSVDELPQFFNVLRGEMSLVGTRPPTLDEWEKYQLHHRKRIVIKPGITGLWQVSGRSNITDFEEVVKLDVSYIKNWSMFLDMKILMKTIWVVLRGKGSS